MARKSGAMLVINNDAHLPADYVGYEMAKQIMLGMSLTETEIVEVIKNNETIFNKALKEVR